MTITREDEIKPEREQYLKCADDCGFSFLERPTSAQIEALCQRVWNEAMEEAAHTCNRLISGDGICADDGVWIHDCAEAIRGLKK